MSGIVAKTRSNFTFLCPTIINFGVGVSAGAPDMAKTLGITKVMVVTDKFLAGTPGVQAIIEAVKNAGLKPVVWPEVVPDPTDTSIYSGTEVYVKEKCDGLIAIGGGSHMDTAKCIGLLALNGGKLDDYYPVNPSPSPITKGPKLVCIPTTSGTGAEVTCCAVVTSSTHHTKLGLGHPLMAPTAAFVDPNLTLTLPPLQTAATGLDALGHAVEGYINLLENPLTDAWALYSLELISKNLRRAVYSGADIEARTNMALAALLSGLVINTTFATAGHAVGQSLGGKFHILHGLSVSLPLPAILEYNLPACEEKLIKIAAAMGVTTECLSPREAAYAAIDEIKQLISDINVPTLAELTKMTEKDCEIVGGIAAAEGMTYLNPRPWTAETYCLILKKTLGLD